jgi:hypothetical protein
MRIGLGALLLIIVAVILIVLLTDDADAGGKVMVKSQDIQNNTIRSTDIHNGSVLKRDLSRGLQRQLGLRPSSGRNGSNGANGRDGVNGNDGGASATLLESDGPYPGRTDSENNLSGDQGDQSTALWANDNTLQQSWVACAPDKIALGGGFGDNDGDNSGLRIVTSAPAQVRGGALVYEPIDGDAAGSFVPNAWLVEGYNSGSAPMIVRPHIICADLG